MPVVPTSTRAVRGWRFENDRDLLFRGKTNAMLKGAGNYRKSC